ncbi:MAG: hypothetical protein ACI8S6_000906 [Myxococcota bacterium]|jgi:hypothetical protein
MYRVITSQRERELTNRMEAIQTAKKLSRRRHEPVMVLHSDNVERMMFRGGRLEEGIFNTPDRRHSARAR